MWTIFLLLCVSSLGVQVVQADGKSNEKAASNPQTTAGIRVKLVGDTKSLCPRKATTSRLEVRGNDENMDNCNTH